LTGQVQRAGFLGRLLALAKSASPYRFKRRMSEASE
jgi:hypothetical protein